MGVSLSVFLYDASPLSIQAADDDFRYITHLAVDREFMDDFCIGSFGLKWLSKISRTS